MARRETLAGVKEERQRFRFELDLYQRALQAVVTGVTPDGEERFPFDDGEYIFKLYESTGPLGGYVVTTWKHPGQRDMVEVQRFDAMLSMHTTTHWLDYRIALDHLKAARAHAIAAEVK